MQDPNWETLNGTVAHEIEVLNYANQVNVIEALIKVYIAQGGVSSSGAANMVPDEVALKELHRTATLFLLKFPGEFRSQDVQVVNADGSTRYQAPPTSDVKNLVKGFFSDLNEIWANSEPWHVAAFCLWKINWIHPFNNGNGRSARALSYACLCLKLGFFLPGRPTVIDLIMSNRSEYYDALRQADLAFEFGQTVDVARLEHFLIDLLTKQLSSIEPSTPTG